MRRSHSVAALILYVAYRYIDVAMIELDIALIEINQQPVSLSHETELQVLQFLERHYRGSRLVGNVFLYHAYRVSKHIVADRGAGRLLCQ